MRIILADDHGLVRDSLRQYLEQLAPDVDIVDAASLHDIRALKNDKPNLVLVDLQMPGMSGPPSLSEVRELFPDARIVVVSGITDPTIIRAVIQHGANGYIPKTSRGKSLVTALRFVLAGETYLPPSMLEENQITSSIPGSGIHAAAKRTTGQKEPGAPGDADRAVSGGFEKLSARETAALRLLISGKSNKEIARNLDLQEVTVKVHLRNVYRKINASSRTDAVRIALQQGWS